MWISSRSNPASSARRVAATKSSRTASMSARVISRGTWLIARQVRQRRRRDQRPVALVERLVLALPQQLRRALAARVPELAADRRAASARGRSRRSASTPRCARRGTGRRSPGVIRPSARDADHLGHHEPGAADRRARRGGRGGSRPACRRPTEYMSIGETTTRLASSSAAQPERREHRRRRRPSARDEVRVAHPQLAVGDPAVRVSRLKANVRGSWLHVAPDALEPLEAALRGALRALDDRPALGLVGVECRRRRLAPPRRARSRPPSRAWCPSRSRSARCARRRRAGRRSRAARTRCAP